MDRFALVPMAFQRSLWCSQIIVKNVAVSQETVLSLCVFACMCLRPGDSRWHSLWLDQQQSLLQWLPQSDHQLDGCGWIKPHSDRPGATAESHCIRSLQRVCVALCFDNRWNYGLNFDRDCQTLPITLTLFLLYSLNASEEFLFQYQNTSWEDGGITVLYCAFNFITGYTVL